MKITKVEDKEKKFQELERNQFFTLHDSIFKKVSDRYANKWFHKNRPSTSERTCEISATSKVTPIEIVEVKYREV